MNLILKTWHEVVLRCFVFFVGYETLDGVKPLHINFNKINGYDVEDHNRINHLTLFPGNEKKSYIKMYIETWKKN